MIKCYIMFVAIKLFFFVVSFDSAWTKYSFKLAHYSRTLFFNIYPIIQKKVTYYRILKKLIKMPQIKRERDQNVHVHVQDD
jgi:hypothetical protein